MQGRRELPKFAEPFEAEARLNTFQKIQPLLKKTQCVSMTTISW
jgi:hypothetical protein